MGITPVGIHVIPDTRVPPRLKGCAPQTVPPDGNPSDKGTYSQPLVGGRLHPHGHTPRQPCCRTAFNQGEPLHPGSCEPAGRGPMPNPHPPVVAGGATTEGILIPDNRCWANFAPGDERPAKGPNDHVKPLPGCTQSHSSLGLMGDVRRAPGQIPNYRLTEAHHRKLPSRGLPVQCWGPRHLLGLEVTPEMDAPEPGGHWVVLGATEGCGGDHPHVYSPSPTPQRTLSQAE